MVAPFLFWTASMMFKFIASEVATLMLLLLPLGSIFNSIYCIASTKYSSYYIRSLFQVRKTMSKAQSSTTIIHITSNSDVVKK
ncbi:hypothetical protein PFISCL1PPCAC_16029 [Pristionchus fissidentatus]|uniref:G protein-coupled receptor n=1 Tax=Pristionchus fissidentatus TaxID=1538716 RepID=A0AAV5W3P4_9BILA|nr:hypothetical protein PFISCL1PPCAC_16029 [Pristionchus fissidentatus]